MSLTGQQVFPPCNYIMWFYVFQLNVPEGLLDKMLRTGLRDHPLKVLPFVFYTSGVGVMLSPLLS